MLSLLGLIRVDGNETDKKISEFALIAIPCVKNSTASIELKTYLLLEHRHDGVHDYILSNKKDCWSSSDFHTGLASGLATLETN